jgi:uncharacterized protein YecE (DUF72 family)
MKKNIEWHIGCSGFHYSDWKLKFYPKEIPQGKWFEYYAEKFNTLELNNTFYRFPRKSLLESWYKRSPESFLFSVKAPRIITHFRKFEKSESLLADFYEVISHSLREKLRCVLFQLPSQVGYTEERLMHITTSLDLRFTNVIEFRDQSWWNKQVYEVLGEKDIAFCGLSHPELPDAIIPNTSLIYYRFHGVPKLYVSLYPEMEIKKFFLSVQQAKNISSAFIYFNNTSNAEAITNAAQLLSFTEKQDRTS